MIGVTATVNSATRLLCKNQTRQKAAVFESKSRAQSLNLLTSMSEHRMSDKPNKRDRSSSIFFKFSFFTNLEFAYQHVTRLRLGSDLLICISGSIDASDLPWILYCSPIVFLIYIGLTKKSSIIEINSFYYKVFRY